MIKDNLADTIAAISTPMGEGGIGIVRLSGSDSLNIADKVFKSNDGKKPSGFKTYTTHYGWIVNGSWFMVHGSQKKTDRQSTMNHELSTNIIDEVILTVMRSPKSYTKEDIVEINCHGGIVATRAVLDLVLENGARLAEPGEFTKRAFLNGRIDLAQAEAVLDIIRAKTDSALKIGTEQLKGTLSKQINNFRKSLLDALTVLEANIDFPEEEIGAADLQKIHGNLVEVNNRLLGLLDEAKHGRIFREGIHVVICGRPNVGKSSLLNALLKQERSIVTPIAGTTRDVIEEIIDIKGIPVRIVDTAGIIEPRDLVEKKAVERSKKYIRLADLVIFMFDASKRLSKEDKALMRKLALKKAIAVINKIDLSQHIQKALLSKHFASLIEISAKKMKNISALEEEIANFVFKGKVQSPEAALIANRRHIERVWQAQKLIEEAVNSLDNRLSVEFVVQDLKDAVANLDSVLGKNSNEDLLDKIFSDFCIGK